MRLLRSLTETIVGGILLGIAGLALLAIPVSIVAAVWWGVSAMLGAK